MRLDVNLKNASDINELNEFLVQHPYSQLNVTEKQTQDWILPELSKINIPICLHISAKHHQDNDIISYLQNAIEQGITSFLLISGIPRPQLDSLDILRAVAMANLPAQWSIVYTPFAQDQEDERDRLLQKISTGIVSEIYLQIGDNIEKIQQEVTWLRTQTTAKVIGSLLIPTPHIRSKFSRVLWQGVELSEQFIYDEAASIKKSKELYQVLQSITDDILVEMFPFSPQDYEQYAAPIVGV